MFYDQIYLQPKKELFQLVSEEIQIVFKTYLIYNNLYLRL